MCSSQTGQKHPSQIPFLRATSKHGTGQQFAENHAKWERLPVRACQSAVSASVHGREIARHGFCQSFVGATRLVLELQTECVVIVCAGVALFALSFHVGTRVHPDDGPPDGFGSMPMSHALSHGISGAFQPQAATDH